jgi:hypothetical protein
MSYYRVTEANLSLKYRVVLFSLLCILIPLLLLIMPVGSHHLQTGRYGHSAALLRDGRVLVVGGSMQLSSHKLDFEDAESTELYDPANDPALGTRK